MTCSPWGIGQSSCDGHPHLPESDTFSWRPGSLIKNSSHRWANCLVGAVNTADPTARPALAFEELFTGSLDAPLPGFELFGVFDPADELVARQRSDLFPQRQHAGISKQRLAEIRGQLVNGSTGYVLTHHAGIVRRARRSAGK